MPSDHSDHGVSAALVYGYWGQNIGNAFFNLGGEHVLRKAIGPENVKLVHDQSAYWTFRKSRKGNHPRALNLIARLDTDLVVLQGPVFTRHFGTIWEPTLRALQNAGRHWAVLGAGFRRYSEHEKRVAAEMLQRFPPLFVATRDRPTYDHLNSLLLDGVALHDGIDSGFFCRDRYTPAPITAPGPMLCLTFDHFPEPRLVPDSDGAIVLNGTRYRPRESPLATWLVKRNKALGVAINFATPGPREVGIAGFEIVRATHRTNPYLPRGIFRSANTLASDEPYSYLSLYAASNLTLSDRVHACVAALTYGQRAMLLNDATKRAALLDRVGCSSVRHHPTRLEPRIVDAEMERTVRFVRDATHRLASPMTPP